MTSILRLVIAMSGLALVGAAAAVPVQLSEAQFTAQIAGKPTIVETFEGFPTGAPGSPFTIANGTYTGNPSIMTGFWCGPSQCMNSNIVSGSFDGFPAGTTLWGTKIRYSGAGTVLPVTVIGNSGSLQINLPPAASGSDVVLVGFFDPTGLQSATFGMNEQKWNYGFDDVTTAAVTAPTLDIDGNGAVDALTDGLLVIRYLIGLRGDALITGAVGSLATRTSAEVIEIYLQTLLQ